MHNKVVYHTMKAFQSFGLPVLRFNFRGTGLYIIPRAGVIVGTKPRATIRLGFASGDDGHSTRAVPVVASALGPDAGLVGAAALVLAGDRYWSAG